MTHLSGELDGDLREFLDPLNSNSLDAANGKARGGAGAAGGGGAGLNELGPTAG